MPDNYPDLSTVFDQLGPLAGAYATGQRQQMGLQSQALDQVNQAAIGQGRLLDNQFNGDTMDLRKQQLAAQLAQTQATTQNTLANAQGQGLANQITSGTMDTTIAGKNAANRASIDENTAKGLQAVGQYMGQFGQELASVPVQQRQSVMAGMLQANPGLKNSAGFNAIMQMPPEQQPGALQQLSQKLVATSPTAQMEQMKLSQESSNQLKAIGAQGANQRELLQMQIDAGKYDKNSKASLDIDSRIDMENDPVKKLAALIDAAQQSQANGDDVTAQRYLTRARSLQTLANNKLAAAGAVNTTLGPTGIVNASRGSAVPNSVPSLGPNGPQENNQAPTLSSVQAQYPGVPADKLRAAYKAKFGVDLK